MFWILIRIALTKKNEKVKKFWSFVKSLKKEAFGITSLRENGILKTDTLNKANICNKQFESAFTRESDSEIPCKGTSPFTPMGEITVDPKGVLKLFNSLNIYKGIHHGSGVERRSSEQHTNLLGMGYVILLWHSLSLPYNYFGTGSRLTSTEIFSVWKMHNLSKYMWSGCRRADQVVSQAYPVMPRYALAFLHLRQPLSLLHLGKRDFG